MVASLPWFPVRIGHFSSVQATLLIFDIPIVGFARGARVAQSAGLLAAFAPSPALVLVLVVLTLGAEAVGVGASAVIAVKAGATGTRVDTLCRRAC